MLFRRCVRAAPTSAPARLNLASALTEQGNLSAAVRPPFPEPPNASGVCPLARCLALRAVRRAPLVRRGDVAGRRVGVARRARARA